MVGRAIADLGNGLHVHGHLLLVGAGGRDALEVLLILHILELGMRAEFLAVVDEAVGAAWAEDLVALEAAHHGRRGVLLEETSEVNRVNDSVLVALGADEFGVAGPDAHAKLDLGVVVLVFGLGVVDEDANQLLFGQVLAVTALFGDQGFGNALGCSVFSHLISFDL